jgi:hypothetical protein
LQGGPGEQELEGALDGEDVFVQAGGHTLHAASRGEGGGIRTRHTRSANKETCMDFYKSKRKEEKGVGRASEERVKAGNMHRWASSMVMLIHLTFWK